jgi:hypothetical protein
VDCVDEEWLTVREASAATSISATRIYSLINRRKVTANLRTVGKGARILVVKVCDVTAATGQKRQKAHPLAR